MDNHRLGPTARRRARSRWLRSRSRDHRRRRPDRRRRAGSADAYNACARPRGEPRLIVRSEYIPEVLVYAGFGHHSTFNHRLIAANMSTTPGLTGPRRLDRKNPQYRSHGGTRRDLMGEIVLGIELVPQSTGPSTEASPCAFAIARQKRSTAGRSTSEWCVSPAGRRCSLSAGVAARAQNHCY